MLTQVTEARSKVGSIQATPELINDPQAFAKFQAAQAASQAPFRVSFWWRRTIRNSRPTASSATSRPSSRDGEPDRRRAEPLHQGRPGVQRDGALDPEQSDGDALRL